MAGCGWRGREREREREKKKKEKEREIWVRKREIIFIMTCVCEKVNGIHFEAGQTRAILVSGLVGNRREKEKKKERKRM